MTETIVIKVGGHASKLLDDQFYHQLAKWRAQEKHVLIIHGGGPQISQWLDLMKLPNQGRRGPGYHPSLPRSDSSRLIRGGSTGPVPPVDHSPPPRGWPKH